MANIIKCRGIVLKTTPFKESSLIASVFTDRMGKVRLMAKGIRRPKSKMCGAMEPFSLDEIIFYRREFKDIYTLSDAVVVDCFPRVRGDPYRVGAAMVVCEYFDKSLPMEEPDTAVFSELVSFLKRLENVPADSVRALVFGHLARALSGSGVMPHLDDCVRCHRSLHYDNNKVDFSVGAGGLVCKDHHDDTVVLLSRQTVTTLKDRYRKPDAEIDDAALEEIEGFMADYMYLHLNNLRLRSLKHFK